jgi:CDP-diglyceride synthetase
MPIYGFTVCFAIAVFPLTYLLSQIFAKPASGETMASLFGLGTGLVLYGTYYAFVNSRDELLKDVFKALYWLFLLFPHFAFCDTFANLMFMNQFDFMIELKRKVLLAQNSTMAELRDEYGKSVLL